MLPFCNRSLFAEGLLRARLRLIMDPKRTGISPIAEIALALESASLTYPRHYLSRFVQRRFVRWAARRHGLPEGRQTLLWGRRLG